MKQLKKSVNEELNSLIKDGLTGGFHFDEECAMDLQKLQTKINFIIEQAEKVEGLERENRGLQITIGKYAGQIQEVIGKQQALCNEGLTIARNMFRGDLD